MAVHQPSSSSKFPQIRAALYARVSTNHAQNPEMQLKELHDYCRRREWYVAGEYVDRGISGSQEGKPELARLFAECRKRRVDAVVVYRYDRFARSSFLADVLTASSLVARVPLLGFRVRRLSTCSIADSRTSALSPLRTYASTVRSIVSGTSSATPVSRTIGIVGCSRRSTSATCAPSMPGIL
jgi:hypothetical protein